MITLTVQIQEKTKTKPVRVVTKRKIELYHSMDKARARISTIVKEMKSAQREKRTPKLEIIGVSYDTSSERTMLLEMGAITSIDNESNY